jgi:hypothetical protein
MFERLARLLAVFLRQTQRSHECEGQDRDAKNQKSFLLRHEDTQKDANFSVELDIFLV